MMEKQAHGEITTDEIVCTLSRLAGILLGAVLLVKFYIHQFESIVSALMMTTAKESEDNQSTVVQEKQQVIEISSIEVLDKVRKLQKLQRAGVPIPALIARCQVEGIDPSWIVKKDDSVQVEIRFVPPPSQSSITPSTASTENELFRLNQDGDVEFRHSNAAASTPPLHVLVKKLVGTTAQRRGSLDMKTGTGTYLVASMGDLKLALNAFRSIAFLRDEFFVQNKDEDDDDDTERCRQRGFLEQLSYLGIRVPDKNECADFVIPGLDDLIAFVERFERPKNIQDMDGMYEFDDLATLFRPGTLVLAKNAVATGVDAACRVIWSRYEQGKTSLGGTVRKFIVNFQFVAAIGDHFTICEFSETLEEFENLRRIDLLPFRPLNSMKDVSDIIDRFRQRGKIYEKIAVKSSFLGYMQGSFYAKATGGRSAISALRSDGRVMVDTVGAYDAGHSLSTGYDGMVNSVQQKAKECVAYVRQLRQASARAAAINHNQSVSDDHLLLLKSIPSHLLALTWPAVTGFSFTRKVWGDVLVDGLFEIAYAESTFDRLVLPPARKRMIKALVRHSSDTFHDIVSGKGEGSVFLLFGPPGCGKTLTAEAISEMLHRPLYSVSIGQLGTTPAELESKLGEILDLCSRWDALILLDEADLFLEKRSHGGSLERNAMVSVMLRLVEYFKGVLFLTSNRVDSLDPAFKTRITLALNYEPLDESAREQVWRNLLEASGQKLLVEQGLIHPRALARYELNGREIKNSIRLALSLAAEDGISLSQACLLETVEMLCHFNEKLESADPY